MACPCTRRSPRSGWGFCLLANLGTTTHYQLRVSTTITIQLGATRAAFMAPFNLMRPFTELVQFHDQRIGESAIPHAGDRPWAAIGSGVTNHTTQRDVNSRHEPRCFTLAMSLTAPRAAHTSDIFGATTTSYSDADGDAVSVRVTGWGASMGTTVSDSYSTVDTQYIPVFPGVGLLLWHDHAIPILDHHTQQTSAVLVASYTLVLQTMTNIVLNTRGRLILYTCSSNDISICVVYNCALFDTRVRCRPPASSRCHRKATL